MVLTCVASTGQPTLTYIARYQLDHRGTGEMYLQGIRDFVFRDSADSQVACRRKLKWLNLLDLVVKVGINTQDNIICQLETVLIIDNLSMIMFNTSSLFRDCFSSCLPSSYADCSSSHDDRRLQSKDFHFLTLPSATLPRRTR